MKRNFINLLAIALVAGALCTACGSGVKNDSQSMNAPDNLHDISDSANTAEAQWEKYKAGAQAKIAQNEDSIAAYRQRIAAGGTKMKERYNMRIVQLQEANIKMKSRIDQYQEIGKEKWSQFETAFTKDMDSLQGRLHEVFSDDSLKK